MVGAQVFWAVQLFSPMDTKALPAFGDKRRSKGIQAISQVKQIGHP
jgi:hypothetical protein